MKKLKQSIFNKGNNIVFVGGNYFKQNNPCLNFMKICKKNKVRFILIVSKKRIKYPTETYGTLKQALKKYKYKYIIKDKVNLNFLKKITDKRSIIFLTNTRWIVDKATINYFKNRIFNFHPSSLTNYRGAASHSWRIMQNQYKDTINIHQVNQNLDDGKIILEKKINFPKKCKNLQLSYKYLSKYENNLFRQFLFSKHKFINQNKNTFYWPKLKTERDGLINWEWNANDVVSFCKAFDEPFVGASTYLSNKKVYFKNVSLVKTKVKFHPFQTGIIFRKNNKGYFIAANKGAILVKNIFSNTKIKINLGSRFFTPIIKIKSFNVE